VDSPLHPCRHRRRWLTRDRLHPPPWMSIWRHHHRLRPLQRQLLAFAISTSACGRRNHCCPSWTAPACCRCSTWTHLSSLAIAQMGWPRLPPSTGGPNGPRSGRHIGRLGGGGGEWRGKASARRGKPRRGRALRSRAGARRGFAPSGSRTGAGQGPAPSAQHSDPARRAVRGAVLGAAACCLVASAARPNPGAPSGHDAAEA
jgi:hypothetical protein